MTQRGDAYRITFDLPVEAVNATLFLETEGYYYEWMRGEWAGEENPLMAALIFSDPAAALVAMAPAFKTREANLEESFWSSRFRADRGGNR